MKHKKAIVPLDEMVKTVVKAVVMDAEKYLLSQGLEKEVIRDIRQTTKILLQQQTLPIKKFVVMNGIDENTVLPINQIAYLKACGSYTEVCAGDGRIYLHSALLHSTLSQLQRDGCEQFIRISRSVAVNYNYITQKIGDTVTVMGQEFTITPSYKNKFEDCCIILKKY